MVATIERKNIHIGCDRTKRSYVLGVQFGPMLLCANCSLAEALDEFDERYGARVEADDSALADYDGDTVEDRIGSAMDAGDVRVNDCGTMVWVDHYEWCQEFRSVREAGRFFRGGWNA